MAWRDPSPLLLPMDAEQRIGGLPSSSSPSSLLGAPAPMADAPAQSSGHTSRGASASPGDLTRGLGRGELS